MEEDDAFELMRHLSRRIQVVVLSSLAMAIVAPIVITAPVSRADPILLPVCLAVSLAIGCGFAVIAFATLAQRILPAQSVLAAYVAARARASSETAADADVERYRGVVYDALRDRASRRPWINTLARESRPGWLRRALRPGDSRRVIIRSFFVYVVIAAALSTGLVWWTTERPMSPQGPTSGIWIMGGEFASGYGRAAARDTLDLQRAETAVLRSALARAVLVATADPRNVTELTDTTGQYPNLDWVPNEPFRLDGEPAATTVSHVLVPLGPFMAGGSTHVYAFFDGVNEVMDFELRLEDMRDLADAFFPQR